MKKTIDDLSTSDLLSAIKSTVEQEGFFLEEEIANIVKTVFKEVSHIETNATFDEHRNDDLPRRGLDVLALGKTTDENSSLKLLACEAKSGGKDSKLILIRKKIYNEHFEPLKIQGYQFGDNNEGLNQSTRYFTHISKETHPLYCRTGDFYKWNISERKFKKSNTNLYKATEQLFYGIEGLLENQYMEFWEDSLIGLTLIPILVTNVDIYVAQSEEETTTTKVDFAILENSIRFRHFEFDSDPHKNFVNKVFPYCWVVNITALAEFLKKPFSFNQSIPISWK